MTKALLVEDYIDNAIVLTALLRDEGYEVDCVSTKTDALNRLHANRYDIGVIDLGLPDSRGLETFDAIHGAAPVMPIVILSAIDDPAVVVEAMKRGAKHYHKKSVDPNALLESLVDAMAQVRP